MPRGRKLYARQAEVPDEKIATDTQRFWHSQSRLAFHEKHDFYPEFGRKTT
jgi:hypothetical protein